eukprot:CAMPEP_0196164956 /NCGR_PEP_ID=MMETSP0911-20130528/1003_1 /TAXON_ID=49265 /ORGANISM="Thalassiosira rotula, Strain GSO102" /LENGTH=44 /DNA_ID= /DNA_START= /DNA_END= /DNA_ORIENTATION=
MKAVCNKENKNAPPNGTVHFGNIEDHLLESGVVVFIYDALNEGT